MFTRNVFWLLVLFDSSDTSLQILVQGFSTLSIARRQIRYDSSLTTSSPLSWNEPTQQHQWTRRQSPLILAISSSSSSETPSDDDSIDSQSRNEPPTTSGEEEPQLQLDPSVADSNQELAGTSWAELPLDSVNIQSPPPAPPSADDENANDDNDNTVADENTPKSYSEYEGGGGVLVDKMDWRDLAASRFDRPENPDYYRIESMERHFPLKKGHSMERRPPREPTNLAEIKAKAAEVLPPNRGPIIYSPYIPPQGEAFKENIFGEGPPELITIDAFDILIQLRAEVGLFFRDTLMEATGFNARLTRPEFFTAAYERAYAEVWEEMPCFGVKHGLTAKEWWHAVTKRTYGYAPMTEPGLREELDDWLLDEVFDVLYHDVFMTQEAWELREGVIESLSFLKRWRDEDTEDSPRALVILSNYDERLHAILDELDILDVFDFCLTAREIGVAMPERAAFQVAMARCGISDPKRCMHITADVEGGLIGASLADWHAVYCPADDSLDLPEGLDEHLIFSQMRDLFGVLRVWNRGPKHRLITTTTPILERGVDAYEDKIWQEMEDMSMIDLDASEKQKSWDGPYRF